jgi:hypothetical protein
MHAGEDAPDVYDFAMSILIVIALVSASVALWERVPFLKRIATNMDVCNNNEGARSTDGLSGAPLSERMKRD